LKRARWILVLAFLQACSASAPKPTAPPPKTAPAADPSHTLSRANPNIVEETETYYIERLPKKDYVRVDDRHVRHPLVPNKPVEFFKEDDDYYYISVAKALPEELEAQRRQREAKLAAPAPAQPPAGTSAPKSAVPLSDFEDLNPPRTQASFRLRKLAETGLPSVGMWRASFTVADMNGDGIADIVAPPSRLGDGKLHVWIGDGKGHFSEWPMTFRENGRDLTRFAVDYGGVAVGDIDGDGKLDVVVASHSGGLFSLFGDGRGGFEVVRAGLPTKDFSAQAVALLDANGDGKLDIVASRDILREDAKLSLDPSQVRLYVFLGREKGWEFASRAIVGGFYSNCLTAWDFDGDGRKDVLTGSNHNGALTLLWKNKGDASFEGVMFPAIEIYSFHFATAPGTFGKKRVPAFADAIQMATNVPQNVRAGGVTLYSFEGGVWTKHRIWRKKEPKGSVYGLAMGDLNRDGLDDVVFPDPDTHKLRILLQQEDGSFAEVADDEEPVLDSTAECVRLVDLDGDGRLDVVVSKSVSSANPQEKGGWDVYKNEPK
jgi:hypothetical protein